MEKNYVGQWPKVAHFWNQIASPLRPADEDILFCSRIIKSWCQENETKPLRALILGVTPEYYHLQWPLGTKLQAIDRTQAMIEHVWPGPSDAATRADWTQMPYAQKSMDLALCDGGLHLLAHPDEQIKVAENLAEIVAPNGYVVFRLFVPPTKKESPAEVIAALLSGEIPDLNCLKLRLGMALQQNPVDGVSLENIWQTLNEVESSRTKLAERLRWKLEHLSAIDAYRESSARYHFVSVEEVTKVFCDGTKGAFRIHQILWPTYRMGKQCPTVSFARN